MLSYRFITLSAVAASFLFACGSPEQEPAPQPQQQATQAEADSAGAPAVQQAEAGQTAPDRSPKEGGVQVSATPGPPQAAAPSQSPEPESASSPSTPPVPMAPQTARVTASIADVETAGNAYICTMTIQQVHGYGSATPPLPQGKTLQVAVRATQIEQAGDRGRRLTQTGNTVDVTLKYQQPMAMSQTPPWSVAEIH